MKLRQAKKIMKSDWTGRDDKQVWRAHVRVRRTSGYKRRLQELERLCGRLLHAHTAFGSRGGVVDENEKNPA